MGNVDFGLVVREIVLNNLYLVKVDVIILLFWIIISFI